jgi:hypothetical protein
VQWNPELLHGVFSDRGGCVLVEDAAQDPRVSQYLGGVAQLAGSWQVVQLGVELLPVAAAVAGGQCSGRHVNEAPG